MIRRVQLSLNSANRGKLDQLSVLMDEALRVLNIFVGQLWEQKIFHGSFTQLSTNTWLSARMQQCLGKQALSAVKSQRKRSKRSMPVIRQSVLDLDQRFLTFGSGGTSFDFWVTLGSLGNHLKLTLPSRKHRHFHKFTDNGWVMSKSGRLRKTNSSWFLDVFFEKGAPPVRRNGKSLGVDCGYKKLIACSDGQITGTNIEKCYEKIARKRRNSGAYRKALAERDQLVHKAVNDLDLTEVGPVVVEALHNVKRGSKGKIRKSFNNKLQYWSYRKCFAKLQSVCELTGRPFVTVEPAYTSQTCSLCGHVDRTSRQGEQFRCTRCGMEMDADLNASKNILMRGVCSPPSLQPKL